MGSSISENIRCFLKALCGFVQRGPSECSVSCSAEGTEPMFSNPNVNNANGMLLHMPVSLCSSH
jgi:hypothetical protein